jgi:hypothetical protein
MSMIKDSRDWRNGLNAAQVIWLEDQPLARVHCRGSGRHRFHLNELSASGVTPPEGIDIIPLADGTCEVRDHCIRVCGRYQSYLTDEEGAILWDTRDYGTTDRSYFATGMDITRADDRRYLQHLTQGMLARAIGKRIKIAQRAALQSVRSAG